MKNVLLILSFLFLSGCATGEWTQEDARRSGDLGRALGTWQNMEQRPATRAPAQTCTQTPVKNIYGEFIHTRVECN